MSTPASDTPSPVMPGTNPAMTREMQSPQAGSRLYLLPERLGGIFNPAENDLGGTRRNRNAGLETLSQRPGTGYNPVPAERRATYSERSPQLHPRIGNPCQPRHLLSHVGRPSRLNRDDQQLGVGHGHGARPPSASALMNPAGTPGTNWQKGAILPDPAGAMAGIRKDGQQERSATPAMERRSRNWRKTQ